MDKVELKCSFHFSWARQVKSGLTPQPPLHPRRFVSLALNENNGEGESGRGLSLSPPAILLANLFL